MMKSIIFIGRAGQGAKTAAEILAQVLFISGYQVQSFPEYGAARAGALMKVYLRYSKEPIRLHCAIENPDLVISLDQGTSRSQEILNLINKQAKLILNLADNKPVKKINNKIYWLDANKIALKYLPRAMTNIVMLGALAKCLPELSLERLKRQIKSIFAKKGEKTVTINHKMLIEAYQIVKLQQ